MTDDGRAPVTVLGLGSMGRAVAEAFLAAGYRTTVWNRSPDKIAPLVARGAVAAPDISAAVSASPLIVSVLTGFDVTLASLAPAGGVASGRTLVSLNSGTPGGARALAEWASAHGARYLGGAIKNIPAAVGNPDTLLYYGGPCEVFDEQVETLRVLGGDTVHLGAEPDLAALYETAVGATLLPTLLGFFEGAAMLGARGLPARSMVPYATKWLHMIAAILPIMAEEIDTADYTKLGSSVDLFHASIGDEAEFGAEAGVDMSWREPMHDLLRRAVAEGYGAHSITALVEVLGRSAA
ncbi:NAD(P)-binding domain-containing protein [Nocardia sp. NPDC050710]|uniref:NAD(P)-dependent oxidoreductase n=1 Tax=Nocardia sp. NPDC050710 TaxID=3157220 RepID=UPI0033E89B9F